MRVGQIGIVGRNNESMSKWEVEAMRVVSVIIIVV